jgi:amino acid adenylation domain-containing protein
VIVTHRLEEPVPQPRHPTAGQAQSARPAAPTLPDLFAAAAMAHPGRVAISAPDGELAYRELNSRSDSVARSLRQAGAGPDVVVPLLAETGPDLVVGMLGILKAGAAYLPIDPAAPHERIRWLIENSGGSVVLATTRTAGLVGASGLVGAAGTLALIDRPEPAPDAPPTRPVRDTDLAYVIHTSGSTGKPKGVQVEHRNVVRLFEQTRSWFGFMETDVWTMFHSAAFDFSVWEIWGALLHGGRLVLVPYEIARSPARFRALVARERVTVLNQTPSAFRQFIAADREHPAGGLPALRVAILGGERLDVAMLAPWFERHPAGSPLLANMFGITETTVHASYRPVTPADLATPEASPIGIPLPDLEFHVIDEHGDPVAGAEPGELYLSGPGVARGYHRRDDLTRERFVDVAGRRAYRSGDRVRRLGNGEYEYLGRLDDQITVRGYRVEPREVEAVLTEHPEVDACLVTTSDHGDGDVRLVAYVVPPPGTAPDTVWWERLRPELTARVAATLPRHLHPSTYLAAAALPLTRNGKADRSPLAVGGPAIGGRAVGGRAVGGPTVGGPTVGGPAVGSMSQREITMIWRDVLGESGFGVEDDFFDVGGTSLSLVRMVDRVNACFRIDLDLAALLDGVTVGALAAEVERATAPAHTPEG